MKKMFLPVIATLFVLTLTFASFAEDLTDGVATYFWGTPPAYEGVYLDSNQSNQIADVVVNADAYIPCYIELAFSNDSFHAGAQSYGPEAWAIADQITTSGMSDLWIRFDNEVGGFVDGLWSSLGTGQNYEAQPNSDTFIKSLEFWVYGYSNDTYRYEVISTGLLPIDPDTRVSVAVLDLQMRTRDCFGSAWGSTWSFLGNGNTNLVADDIAATLNLHYHHEFRVPYHRNVAHGKYSGTITFRAATI